MAYPGTIDSYTPVQGTTLLASVDHAGQHNQAGSAVVALENKLGIGSGSATANQILVGSGAGTTAWGTTWNNGALGSPTITGGTVNSAIFGTPTLNAPTIQNLADNTNGNVGTAAHGFAPKAPNDATKYLDGTGAYSVPASASTDGWTSSSDTWVYASASTFTIAGVDRTAVYTKGTRLKFTQTTAKYAVVISSSFSTDTTVTIAVNTDYTIANAAITLPFYSYQQNPQGYPGWFAYNPTLSWTASVAPSGVASQKQNYFKIDGTSVLLNIHHYGYTSGTGVTGVSIPLPFTITTQFQGATGDIHTGSATPNPCICIIDNNNLSLNCSSTTVDRISISTVYRF